MEYNVTMYCVERFIDVLLNITAIYFITRVIVYEEISEPFRVWLAQKGHGKEKFSEVFLFFHRLTLCFFCTCCWVSAVVYLFGSYKDMRMVTLYIACTSILELIVLEIENQRSKGSQ